MLASFIFLRVTNFGTLKTLASRLFFRGERNYVELLISISY